MTVIKATLILVLCISCTSATSATSQTSSTSSTSSLCLSEDCVLASASILLSVDRSAEACEDFYEFACGGWRERSVVHNTDQFAAIDKRNQNIIHKALIASNDNKRNDNAGRDHGNKKGKETNNNEDDNEGNNDQNENAESNEDDSNKESAEWKARSFYASCVNSNSNEQESSLSRLQHLIDLAGGWDLSGTYNLKLDFQSRLKVIHNTMGLSVFFTWGVIEHENRDRIAVIAGGWNEALLSHDEANQGDYLKLMSMYTLLLAQTTEDVDAQLLPDHQVEDDQDGEGHVEEVHVDEDVDHEVHGAEGKGGYVEENRGYNGRQEDLLSIYNYVDDVTAEYDEYEGDNEYYGGDASLAAPISNLWKMLSGGNLSDDNNDLEIEEIHNEINAENQQEPEGENNQAWPHLHFLGPGSSLSGLSSSLSLMLARNARIESSMRAVIDFERRLAAIAAKPADTSSLVEMSIDNMDSELGFVEWKDFFDDAVQKHAQDKLNAYKNVLQRSEIGELRVLVQPDFLHGLGQLLAEYNSNSSMKPTLTHYMMWRLLAAFYPDRPVDELVRRERCLKETEEMFSAAITAMFIKAIGVDKAEGIVNQVQTMVDAMMDAFESNLDDLPWMSPESRASARRKLAQMTDLIGYPRFVLNDTWLDHVYADLKVIKKDYVSNIVDYRRFVRRGEVRRYLSELQSESEWRDLSHLAHISTVNAFYNQASNTMVVPIGMLQPPLFWQRPRALTFGAFGIVVAHEVTHAFDDVGIQYDANGSFRPLYDSWTQSAFSAASECVRQQYSAFAVSTDVFVDGNATLGENIADLGGLIMAEKAYANWKENNDVETTLPGMEWLSSDQLFYLGYALPWCALHTDHVLRTHIAHDEHAPERFRVIGPLANSHNFARAFDCPIGSPMNPRNKCSIW